MHPFLPGHCTALPLDDKTGFIVWYVTKHSWRRRGIGRKVYDASYATLGKRQAGVTAMWDAQDMYARGGYKVSAHSFINYKIPVNDIVLTRSEFPFLVTAIKEVDFQKLVKYDKKILPLKREQILKWCVESAHVGLVAMDTEGSIKGWGVMVKSHVGYRMMPLYADTPEIAKGISDRLVEQILNEGNSEAIIQVGFPEDNLAAKNLYFELGVKSGCERYSRRMYTEFNVPIQCQFVYSALNTDYGPI